MSKKIEIPVVYFEPIIADDGTVLLTKESVNSTIEGIFSRAYKELEAKNKFLSFKLDFENNQLESDFYILSHHMYSKVSIQRGGVPSRANPVDCFQVLKDYYSHNIILYGTYEMAMTYFFSVSSNTIHFEELYFPMEIYEKSTLSIMAKEFFKSQKAEKN